MTDATAHATSFYKVLGAALECAAHVHDDFVEALVLLRETGGRLFCVGMGGGAANAAHAVNDFRKLCGIEAYAPTDGVSEFSARANDEGLDTVFAAWLEVSRLGMRDALLVFSVGGGQKHASRCIAEAVGVAVRRRAKVLAVLGRDDGTAALHADAAVITAVSGAGEGEWLTPVTEAAQIAVLHALVSDPRLQINATKW